MQRFTEFLEQLRDGGAVDDLTTQLAKVVEAVDVTGKVGTLALTIKVAPNSRGSVTISDDIKGKPPTSVEDTILYVDHGYGLTRRNPRQTTMDALLTVGQEN